MHSKLNRQSVAQLNSQRTAPELTTHRHHSHANALKRSLGAHANLLLLLPSSEEDSVSIANGWRAVLRSVTGNGTGWQELISKQCRL